MTRKISLISLQLTLALLSLTGSAADFTKGLDAYKTGDYETALAEWAPLAEQGDAGSQFGLGLLYSHGWGVDLDDAAALKWYELAAAQGHGEAAYNIGVMYQNGWGVDQSDAETFKWMQMAATAGFPAAHRAMGDIFANGIGAEMNLVQAYSWFETGAKLGDSESNYDREELATSMQPDDVTAARQMAKAWADAFSTNHPDFVWPEE
ncbi:MAG: sel1 repeat family protein [Gammaproteobacteria bacterium]|nr:sel1 repeat family protein [Gammaproteobacteria bacterium]MDH5213772.1 sel1 repeat family protein [Gammaproteobacteria bacterium]